MAISTVNVSTPANELIFQDTAIGSSIDGIKSSSAVVYSVTVDNTANGGQTVYLKLWNIASGSVTLGVSVPDEVILAPAGLVVTAIFKTGAAGGKVFGTALSAACVTTGGTAGVVAPSSSVICSINYV